MHIRRWWLALVLALCGVPAWTLFPPVRAAGPAIDAFYTTTRAAFDTWNGSQPRPKVTSFAPGTNSVAYYFAYSGIMPMGTAFQVTEYAPGGEIVKGRHRLLTNSNGAFMAYFPRNIAYRPGLCRFDLTMTTTPAEDALFSRLVASIHFLIQPGTAVPAFYTITKNAYDARPHEHYAVTPPARVASFRADTVYIAYYFQYAGVRPGHSFAQIRLMGPNGVTNGHLHVLPYAIGWFTDYFYYRPTWPTGSYRFLLFIDGRLMGSTRFTVRPSAVEAACSVKIRGSERLFATSPSVFDTWQAGRHARPMPVHRLPSGTRILAWYFADPRSVARTTYFQIAFEGPQTAISTISDIHTFACAGSAWMGLLYFPKPLPAGLYHPHAYVDGNTTGPSATVRIG